MWTYNFMQHALIAGLIIAILCGSVSVFVILRHTSFAAHALGHMSLTGAAAAGLFNISAMVGQLVLNLGASIIMGIMGEKVRHNDLAIGVVLSFVLGLGAYCLFLFQNNYAGSVMSILFGDIFAVSLNDILLLGALAIIAILALIILSRPLIFASIDPVIAKSQNLPIKVLSISFFVILAITVSLACQIVGALLVFVLLIIPGACGLQWGKSILESIVISNGIAIIAIILALFSAFYFNLPVSFCITMILCLAYAVGAFKNIICV